jgi:hypothetical protein
MSAVLLVKCHKEKIKINPFILSGDLYPLKDNGYGEFVEDRNLPPIVKTYANKVRVSFLKRQIQKLDANKTPVTIEQRYYYMISDNETKIDLRLEFNYNGVVLKVKQRKELRKFNSLIGYEYELNNITEGSYA